MSSRIVHDIANACLSRHVIAPPGVFSRDTTTATLAATCAAVDQHVVCEQEVLRCRACSTSTRHLKYTTKFHDVMATCLADEQHRLPGRSLGQLLQAVDMTRRSCDLDHGTANLLF